MIRFVVILLALLLFHAAYGKDKEEITNDSLINKIEIVGNKRTEDSTIISYLNLKIGDDYTKEKANESIRTLYATEFFSEIKLKINNNILYVNVEENPIVNQVEIQGAEGIKVDMLRSELSLKPRTFFSKAKLQKDVNRIIEVYGKTGRFATTIKPKIAKLPQNRVDVLFKIKESKKAKIKKIYFIGSNHFSNNILKNVINSKEDKLYNILRTNHYDPDIVDYDKVLLTKFYYNHGYINFKIISATADIVPSENGFYITFSIEEGNRFNFGNVEVDNDISSIKSEKIRDLITVKTGEIFKAKTVDSNKEEIIKYLSNKGFPFVKVTSEYNIDNTNRVVNMSYKIFKSPKIYIGKIKISGNTKTYDYIIRKELRLVEGDPYNAFLLKRSEQRLRNLDFFEKLSITTEKTSRRDVVDVNIQVSEKSTASLQFSAGYSNTDGVLGNINFQERNLLGKGQGLSLNYKRAYSTYSGGFSFMQPSFMGSEIDAGVSFNISSENNTSKKLGQDSNSIAYNSTSYSGLVYISYEIIEHLGHQVSYSLANSKIDDVFKLAPLIFREQVGTNTVSAISHKLTYDRVDSYVKPTSGYITSFSQSIAGLGGDSRYFKNILEGKYFYSIVEDLVLKMSAEVGHIEKMGVAVRVNENFFLGDQSLRGFEYGGLGPRDRSRPDKGSLGGTTYYKGSVEALFPIPGVPKDLDITASTFIDFGNVFNVDLAKNSKYTKNDFYNSKEVRISAGVGMVWVTNMGPLRLDFAKPIKKEHFDKEKLVLFSMHTAL